jgi:hypothetical protein
MLRLREVESLGSGSDTLGRGMVTGDPDSLTGELDSSGHSAACPREDSRELARRIGANHSAEMAIPCVTNGEMLGKRRLREE